MKQLVLGGSGLLGSNYNLLNRNKYLYNFTHKNTATNAKNIKINKKNIEEFVKKEKIKAIINFAALTNIEFCEKNKKKTYETNVLLPVFLSQIAKKLSIKFVHISTDHFFSKKYPIDEKAKVRSLNYYSFSKLIAEKKILKHNSESVILRTNFFGSYTKKKSFSENIKNKIKKKSKIYLFDDVYFNPVSIKFLIKIIQKVLLNKNIKGLFNVSSDSAITKYEFGKFIAKKYRLPYKYIFRSSLKDRINLVRRPKKMILRNSKLKKYFKIKEINLLRQI